MIQRSMVALGLFGFCYSFTPHAQATLVTAVGSSGTIVQSADGGNSWTPRPSNTGPSSGAPALKDVAFVNLANGWAIGDSLAVDPTVRRTVDGGQSWQTVSIPPAASQPGHGITGVHFVTIDVGWLIGNPGMVFRTTDGGTTWHQQSNGVPRLDCFGLDFVNVDSGWIVGHDGRGLILHTTNGGTSWSTQLVSESTDILLDVDFVDADSGWVVGTTSVRRTTDGGATWRAQLGGYFPAVDFVDAMTGWVVAEDGIVLHTLDGGENWVEQYRSANSLDLLAIDFISRDEGWVAGVSGVVLHTTNGGATWTQQATGTTATFYGISAIVPEPSAAVALLVSVLTFAIFWRGRCYLAQAGRPR